MSNSKMSKNEAFKVDFDNLQKISRRFVILPETLKALKKMVIELDMDNDGKISNDMLGACIDMLVQEKENKTPCKRT